eukprot:253691-Amphidinium_carterae.1
MASSQICTSRDKLVYFQSYGPNNPQRTFSRALKYRTNEHPFCEYLDFCTTCSSLDIDLLVC